MNKKHITHILILLIVIKNVFAQSIIETYNVENEEDYWTQERMLNAKPMLPPISRPNKTIKNYGNHLLANVLDSDSINTDDPLPAVGIIFLTLDGVDISCSASVIDTSDGNTGITAAHCLYNNGVYAKNVIFCPGYNNGQSALGQINVIGLSVPKSYMNDDRYDDYAAIKFDYPSKLKYKTGSFGWGLNPPKTVSVAIFGYPFDGDLNCNKNGRTFCAWRGDAVKLFPFTKPDIPALRVPVTIGSGGSGGPWLMRNSGPLYLGYLIGVTSFTHEPHSEYSSVLNFTLIRTLTDWP